MALHWWLPMIIGFCIARPAAAEPNEHLTALLEQSDRELVYEIRSDFPLKIRIEPQDTHLKILSYLNIDTLTAADSEQEFVYRLGVEFIDEGGHSIQETSAWERTRRSSVERDGRRLVRFFYLNGGEAPADGRVSYFQPPRLDEGGFMSIRLLEPAGHSASVQVFRSLVRDADIDERRWSGLRPDIRANLLDRNLYDADNLSHIEKILALTRRWIKLPAQGRMGVDYKTRELFSTGLRLERPREEAPEHDLVLPGVPYVVTVRGPGVLDISLEPQAGPGDAVITVSGPGSAEEQVRRRIPGPVSMRLPVDDGPRLVQVETDEPM
ncbi:hypothetical protein JW905_03510, partial [bacterium]|nr:hypothetical protein [candidate division CSSED10-310 bacterium]